MGLVGAVGVVLAEEVAGAAELLTGRGGGGNKEGANDGATDVGGAKGPGCKEEERGGAELTEGEDVEI